MTGLPIMNEKKSHPNIAAPKKLVIPTRFLHCLFTLIICLISLMAVTGCSNEPEKSRMEKRISIYLNNLQDSAIELQHELENIENAKVTNTPARMRRAGKIVEQAEKVLEKANRDVTSYIAFINANRTALRAEGLDLYLDVKGLLNHALTTKRRAMAAYFSQLKKWLDYSAANYNKLVAKNVSARRSYDALLTKVNRSLKQYETANEKYHSSVEDFLIKNPGMKTKFKRRYKTMKKELEWR